jgi:hypothetical protein
LLRALRREQWRHIHARSLGLRPRASVDVQLCRPSVTAAM